MGCNTSVACIYNLISPQKSFILSCVLPVEPNNQSKSGKCAMKSSQEAWKWRKVVFHPVSWLCLSRIFVYTEKVWFICAAYPPRHHRFPNNSEKEQRNDLRYIQTKQLLAITLTVKWLLNFFFSQSLNFKELSDSSVSVLRDTKSLWIASSKCHWGGWGETYIQSCREHKKRRGALGW